ncbi:MAG: hypothetical protein EXR71_02205 [Myxococcales bacterium]|nr:hypothetical protein [Myxococcales bacterium]
MERRELEDIERFFASLGHRTPLAYFGLREDATAGAVDAALKKRRSWAQGQQANPKYRAEALFLIKTNAGLRRLLIEERDAYDRHFGAGNPQLEELDGLIRKSLDTNGWTAATDAAMRTHGRRLELDDSVVEARLGSIAREFNLSPHGDEDLRMVGGMDIYELLAASPEATPADLEAAYRNRYRWARSLKDLERAGRLLAALDAAWRMLRDPQRRALYDARRAELGDATEEADQASQRLGELLGGEAVPNRPSPAEVAEALRIAPRAMRTGESSAPWPQPTSPPPPLRMDVPTGPGTNDVRPPLVTPLVSSIQGRTIGLAPGPQMLRGRAPRLVVSARSPVRLRLPRSRPIVWVLKVENGGQGQMPGRVVSDVAWLAPLVDALAPEMAVQEIAIRLDPVKLPGNAGLGSLTVVTDHGERRTVQFEVERATLVAPLLGLLLVAGISVGGWFGWRAWEEAQRPPEPAVLRLRVDPASATASVDGKPVGSGGSLILAPPHPGEPFRLRVEHDGFRAHEEMVTVDTTSFDRSVHLDLDDDLTWAGNGTPGTLAATAFEVVSRRTKEIAACFKGMGATSIPVTLAMRADQDGQLRGLDLRAEGVDPSPARACVARVVRQLRVVPTPGGWSSGELSLALSVER